eukprot:sb/3475571/
MDQVKCFGANNHDFIFCPATQYCDFPSCSHNKTAGAAQPAHHECTPVWFQSECWCLDTVFEEGSRSGADRCVCEVEWRVVGGVAAALVGAFVLGLVVAFKRANSGVPKKRSAGPGEVAYDQFDQV